MSGAWNRCVNLSYYTPRSAPTHPLYTFTPLQPYPHRIYTRYTCITPYIHPNMYNTLYTP